MQDPSFLAIPAAYGMACMDSSEKSVMKRIFRMSVDGRDLGARTDISTSTGITGLKPETRRDGNHSEE
jgi:hypothetical protein